MADITTMNDRYLMHYGVKGMKWGVRKDRRTISDFSAYRNSSKTIKKNRDGSYTVPKGYTYNRVGDSSMKPNKAGGLYVSSGKDDAARYVKNLGPSLIGKLINEAHTTVQHIEVNKPMKLASEQQTISLLSKAINSNKKVRKEFDDSLYSMAFIDGKPKSDKRTAFAVSSMLGNDEHKSANKYILDYCRKSGYDAIPDLNDRYTGTGATSTIILNTNKCSIKEKTYITKDIYKSGKKYAKSLGKLPVDDIIH